MNTPQQNPPRLRSAPDSPAYLQALRSTLEHSGASQSEEAPQDQNAPECSGGLGDKPGYPERSGVKVDFAEFIVYLLSLQHIAPSFRHSESPGDMTMRNA